MMYNEKNDPKALAREIRDHYTEKAPTDLDRLRMLDRQVKAPANRFAWCFGSVAALILGAGMSLVMTDIGAVLGLEHPMLPGIFVGVIGLVLAVLNYPIYRAFLARRRRKFAPRILALSENLT